MIPATKQQKFAIRKNCDFNEDIKCEWVQWVKQDASITSLNTLSFDEANTILVQQGSAPHKAENWAHFDHSNGKHKKILSLCYEANWVKYERGRQFADTDRLNVWLHSAKCPVKKPLREMTPQELEKIIKSLENIVKSVWK